MPGRGRRPSPLWGAVGGLFAGVAVVLTGDPCDPGVVSRLLCEPLYETLGVASVAAEAPVLAVAGFVAFGTLLGWVGQRVGRRDGRGGREGR